MNVYIVSTNKKDGSLDERFGDISEITQNKKRLSETYDIPLSQFIFADQQHGTNITIVTKKDIHTSFFGSTKIEQTGGVDKLITNELDLFLTVYTADYIPVFFYDEVQHVVGIAHCGWKGVYHRLAQKMIQYFQEYFYSDTKNIVVRTGPSIGGCCYQVDLAPDKRLKLFRQEYGSDVINDKKLDLKKVLYKQCREMMILDMNIQISSECTCCNDQYFSWYREKPKLSGQQIHFIGIRQ